MPKLASEGTAFDGSAGRGSDWPSDAGVGGLQEPSENYWNEFYPQDRPIAEARERAARQDPLTLLSAVWAKLQKIELPGAQAFQALEVALPHKAGEPWTINLSVPPNLPSEFYQCALEIAESVMKQDLPRHSIVNPCQIKIWPHTPERS